MTRKQRRLVLIGSSLGVLALAAVLVLSALKDSIVFFNSPTDVVEKKVEPGSRIRLGGLVKPGSLQRGEKLAVRFEVTDGNRAIAVSYQGILPDLFREGQGVVAEGALEAGGGFKADSGARQARRELHAEGSRRRAEEAGALERRTTEKQEMIAEIGHYALVLALALGADPGGRAVGRGAAARRYADGRGGADRARAVRLRRPYRSPR